MVEGVFLCKSKPRFKFLIDEIIDFIFVLIANKPRMTKVHCIGSEIIHRKSYLYVTSGGLIYLFLNRIEDFVQFEV
jgi:uncharacterized membrane protein